MASAAAGHRRAAGTRVGGVLQPGRQLDRRALLDAEHPRLVRVGAVEARDLDGDLVLRVLRDDERHLLVGEAAVVGDAEHPDIRACQADVDRHVAEHLRGSRPGCAAAGRAGRPPPGALTSRASESRSGGGTGPNTTRSSSRPRWLRRTVTCVPASGTSSSEVVARRRRSRCSRGRACPSLALACVALDPHVPRLADPGARGRRRPGRQAVAPAMISAVAVSVSERQPGPDLEGQRPRPRSAGCSSRSQMQLAVRRERRIRELSLQGRQGARAGVVARAFWDLDPDRRRGRSHSPFAGESEGDFISRFLMPTDPREKSWIGKPGSGSDSHSSRRPPRGSCRAVLQREGGGSPRSTKSLVGSASRRRGTSRRSVWACRACSSSRCPRPSPPA